MTGPDKVRAERLRRGWSVRTASTAGGISNTWWQRYEDGLQPLTPKIIDAVAQAYDWPRSWSVNPPAVVPDEPLAHLQVRVEALAVEVQRLAARVAAQGAELEQLRARRRQGGAG